MVFALPYGRIGQRWGATRAPVRICGRQSTTGALSFLCLPEIKALNPGVRGSAPIVIQR